MQSEAAACDAYDVDLGLEHDAEKLQDFSDNIMRKKRLIAISLSRRNRISL